MMFWLISVVYFTGALTTMRGLFVKAVNASTDAGITPSRARDSAIEWEMPFILFGGILWFVFLPGYAIYRIVAKTVFGETRLEKKVRLEEEKAKAQREAEEAERILKREGWKV